MEDKSLDYMWTASDNSIDCHMELSKVKEIRARAEEYQVQLEAEPV